MTTALDMSRAGIARQPPGADGAAVRSRNTDGDGAAGTDSPADTRIAADVKNIPIHDLHGELVEAALAGAGLSMYGDVPAAVIRRARLCGAPTQGCRS